ncbi:hypothetical protein B0T16DRAFT_389421 [Cercophora newfieldiana]|uniref:Uncharacterized protein n=1 Tax=Cercophora newfieldiana TaxID=92897 RepID=A0AA39YBR0_9PEZI|nr:hypothetical protein B0T16DRAFT_389421 [Cercophora newfieldiana]
MACLFVAFGDRIRWIAKPAGYWEFINLCYREFAIPAHDQTLLLTAYMEFPSAWDPSKIILAEIDPSAYHFVPPNGHIIVKLIDHPHNVQRNPQYAASNGYHHNIPNDSAPRSGWGGPIYHNVAGWGVPCSLHGSNNGSDDGCGDNDSHQPESNWGGDSDDVPLAQRQRRVNSIRSDGWGSQVSRSGSLAELSNNSDELSSDELNNHRVNLSDAFWDSTNNALGSHHSDEDDDDSVVQPAKSDKSNEWGCQSSSSKSESGSESSTAQSKGWGCSPSPVPTSRMSTNASVAGSHNINSKLNDWGGSQVSSSTKASWASHNSNDDTSSEMAADSEHSDSESAHTVTNIELEPETDDGASSVDGNAYTARDDSTVRSKAPVKQRVTVDLEGTAKKTVGDRDKRSTVVLDTTLSVSAGSPNSGRISPSRKRAFDVRDDVDEELTFVNKKSKPTARVREKASEDCAAELDDTSRKTGVAGASGMSKADHLNLAYTKSPSSGAIRAVRPTLMSARPAIFHTEFDEMPLAFPKAPMPAATMEARNAPKSAVVQFSVVPTGGPVAKLANLDANSTAIHKMISELNSVEVVKKGENATTKPAKRVTTCEPVPDEHFGKMVNMTTSEFKQATETKKMADAPKKRPSFTKSHDELLKRDNRADVDWEEVARTRASIIVNKAKPAAAARSPYLQNPSRYDYRPDVDNNRMPSYRRWSKHTGAPTQDEYFRKYFEEMERLPANATPAPKGQAIAAAGEKKTGEKKMTAQEYLASAY